MPVDGSCVMKNWNTIPTLTKYVMLKYLFKNKIQTNNVKCCDSDREGLLYQQRLICGDKYIGCCTLEAYVCQVKL